MSAYQTPTTTTRGTAAAAAPAKHQFLTSLLDDKLIIYGDGLIYGGASYPVPANNMPLQATPKFGGQRLPTHQNNSYTGILNRPLTQQRMQQQQQPQQQQQQQPQQQQQQQQQQQPQQQQQQQPRQQQQLRPQPMTQSHELSQGLQSQRYMNQHQQQSQPLPQQQLQQLQHLQQQPLQPQQQQQQQQRQQQLQQAYNYWPFGGNHNMGGHASQPPQMFNNHMSYGQQAWPGYTVMSPVDPNQPFTFGMN